MNVIQRGDALALLRLLPEAYTPSFFDPQHRAGLDKRIEGFDCNEKSIGIFDTPTDAANAVQRAAGGNHERGGAS
jgi:hypothetical protein